MPPHTLPRPQPQPNSIAAIRATRAKSPWRKIAKRKWPKAEWIYGDGKYATVATCGCTSVTLHETKEKAEKAKKYIDDCGCGHACNSHQERPSPKHQLIDLSHDQ